MVQLPNWLSEILGKKAANPRVPEGFCVYAVGDVHGRRDLLERLLERLYEDAPGSGNILVMLGDYVDRGPDSKGVLDLLIDFHRPGWELVALRGNHDQLLLEFLTNPDIYSAWRGFGGTETLLSYGVKPPMFSAPQDLQRARDDFDAALPQRHRAFLMDLRDSHAVGDYFFVHAGVRPGIALDKQVPEDLLWIREDFLLSNQRFEKVIVHGHTPGERPIVRKNRICVDTGAYATDRLTAVKLSEEGCEFLSTDGTQLP